MTYTTSKRFLCTNEREIIKFSEHPVGVAFELDPSVAHNHVKEHVFAGALGVSRVQYHGWYHLVVTLPEGERWNEIYAERFAAVFTEFFEHDVEFESTNLLIY